MNNRWLQIEYMGKGIALSLVALLALKSPDWQAVGIFFGAAGLGLILLLGIETYRKVREGYRIKGRVPAYLLFLLLENPALVYGGLIGGMIVAIGEMGRWAEWPWWHVPVALLVGVGIGIIYWALRHVTHYWLRRGAVLVLAGLALTGILFAIGEYADLKQSGRAALFGTLMLLAMPVLYLLTFTGRAEETELEIGSICVALGVGLWILVPDDVRLMAVFPPLALYILYVQFIMKSLRVFKHVLRGISFNNMGQHREALLAFQRALTLDPNNAMAKEGRWRVHLDMDFSKVIHDPETMKLVDLNLCAERAGELLMQPPSPERLKEAHKLLDLVLDQRPVSQPMIWYWRAVAHVHTHEFDRAEVELRTVIDGTDYPPNDPYRDAVLLPCWQLALLQHPEMSKRVGQPMLAQEGRRLEAVAAAERVLANTKDEPGAWELKRFLYNGLSEAEYRVRAGADGFVPKEEFDHDYCLQLGLALIGDAGQWRRGAEYLRIAAQGLAMRAPSIYYQIAVACQRAGDVEGEEHNYEQVKQRARAIGVKNLDAEDRKAYFATVKLLGERAYAREDVERAIENWTLYVESQESGLDTLMLLTELYERREDALAALHINEKCLQLDGKNKQALERKDRYYYSVMPHDLAARLDMVKKSFDLGYCLRKAKSLLNAKNSGAEQLDWGLHLLELARMFKPDSIAASALAGQARLKRGEQAEAIALLEEARAAKPEKFADAEEEEGWYISCRLLGDLYLEQLGKPDQAVLCFSDYRNFRKSGADTLYKMGQCYEQLGDLIKAKKCYQNVTIYDHPLASDAQMALHRLESRA